MKSGARLEKSGKISRIPNAFIAFPMDVCRELRVSCYWRLQHESSSTFFYVQGFMGQSTRICPVASYEQIPFLNDEMNENVSNAASGHALPNWIHHKENPNSTIEDSSNLNNFRQPEINSNITLPADLQKSRLKVGQSSYFDPSSGDINFVSVNSEYVM
ncbi:5513_t:CDS:2 [Ambispora leptoticha]|uniref:5513_t:CDS:1 n=1 Tax=Ambispora leptoticha TaxID=144679 RepID=A0A9N9F832_9GLOM|nr:5513_t:CDS:2 [Ambispora leptoticha]